MLVSAVVVLAPIAIIVRFRDVLINRGLQPLEAGRRKNQRRTVD